MGKLIQSSEISVTGKSTNQAIVEFVTGEIETWNFWDRNRKSFTNIWSQCFFTYV